MLEDRLTAKLREAEGRTVPERRKLFEECGQLFGWITDPDQALLLKTIPDIALAREIHPIRIVEVGTFAGSTARGLVTMTGGGRITCIDNFKDMNPDTLGGHETGRDYWEATIRKNGWDLSPFATLIEGTSVEVGHRWRDPIDMLFVDDDHDEEPAFASLSLYAHHVTSGGYVLVDDYHMPSVRRACERYFYSGSSWTVTHQPTGNEKDTTIAIYRRAA